jgi:hypothetical protein
LFITKTPTHYRDSNPGPLVLQSGPQTTRPASRLSNYRLSRARRFVECAFGILSNKWRIFHSSIIIHPQSAKHIIKAACVLHNFVRRRDGYQFEDTIRCDMEEFDEVQAVGGRSSGISVRDSFVQYFNGPGAVPWQNRMIH